MDVIEVYILFSIFYILKSILFLNGRPTKTPNKTSPHQNAFREIRRKILDRFTRILSSMDSQQPTSKRTIGRTIKTSLRTKIKRFRRTYSKY